MAKLAFRDRPHSSSAGERLDALGARGALYGAYWESFRGVKSMFFECKVCSSITDGFKLLSRHRPSGSFSHATGGPQGIPLAALAGIAPTKGWSFLGGWLSIHSEDAGMARKMHMPEEIVAKLQQVDVLVSQGWSVSEAVPSLGVMQPGSDARGGDGRVFGHGIWWIGVGISPFGQDIHFADTFAGWGPCLAIGPRRSWPKSWVDAGLQAAMTSRTR